MERLQAAPKRSSVYTLGKMQRPTEITLVLSRCQDESGLFEYLWRELRFPSLYKVSWHGLGENMFYDPEMRMPEVLKIRGLKSFAQINPSSAKKLESALAGYLLEECDRKVLYE